MSTTQRHKRPLVLKAITTRFLGYTNRRGTRILAKDSDNNRILFADDDFDWIEQRHQAAAYALRDKMGWKGELIGGAVKDGYVWVFAPAQGKEHL